MKIEAWLVLQTDDRENKYRVGIAQNRVVRKPQRMPIPLSYAIPMAVPQPSWLSYRITA